MLPNFNIDNDVVNETQKSTHGINFEFDFSNGEFYIKDGRLQTLEGMEALKIWIEKVLRTELSKNFRS